MKILLFAITILASSASAQETCQPKEKTLPCYVRLLQTKLADYRKSVEAQMQSERDVSSALAEVLATEAERNVYELLEVQRADASYSLASDLAEDRLSPAQTRDRIREIAMREFQTTRQFYEAELSLLVSVLPSLKRNELDVKKLDALNKALTELSTKPELKTHLADMLAFAGEYQKVYQAEACKDLIRGISITAGSIADLQAQLTGAQPGLKEELEGRIKLLQARKADNEKIRDRNKCR